MSKKEHGRGVEMNRILSRPMELLWTPVRMMEMLTCGSHIGGDLGGSNAEDVAGDLVVRQERE